MEDITQNPAIEPAQTFVFKGKGSELFGIQVPNWILTIISLGIYYPWAKAEKLKYLYQKTEFAGSRFVFHGTGKEMFRGFIKAIGILAFIAMLAGTIAYLLPEGLKIFGLLFFYLGLACIIPLSLYGQMRYRTSRSSWRGIHFSYTGNLKSIYSTFLKGIFLSIITFGIYANWFMVSIRKEIISNIRFGNIRFSFEGEGGELFLIHLKGYFLSIFTLGIYSFWWMSELHQFYVNNILIEQNGNYSRLEANVTGSGYFKLVVGNLLITVFTLGLGTPLVTVRTMSYLIDTCELFINLNLENIEQSEVDMIGATFEDVSDILNLDLV